MTIPYIEFERQRDAFLAAARAYGLAKVHEMRLESERHVEKSSAIQRLLLVQNPITEKPYSATAADSFAELDAGYSAHLAKQRDATLARIIADAEQEAARMNMRTAASCVGSDR